MTQHRTLIKVIFNPILRIFGWSIVSVFNDDYTKFIKYEIRRYPEHCEIVRPKK